MRKIYNSLLQNKAGFIVAFVILYILEVLLTWLKYDNISFQELFTIFAEIALKVFLIAVIISVFRVLKEK